MGGYKIVYLYEWGHKMEKSEKGEDEWEVAGLPFGFWVRWVFIWWLINN